MTKKNDKFPAFSGLAQSVGSRQTGRYLAGLWADDIQLGLLWEVLNNRERPALTQPMAPSSSWASLDQQVTHNTPGYVASQPDEFSLLEDVCVTLLEDDIKVIGENKYAQVMPKGSVTLIGLVTQAFLVTEDHRLELRPTVGRRLYTEVEAIGRSASRFQADTFFWKRGL
ncbi:hypothetical protein E8E11_005166 [Didymella keratinophila]|nr:hypothetical protein E8E11_005166 [Didymella keratinophila]